MEQGDDKSPKTCGDNNDEKEVKRCGCKEGTFRIVSGLILVVLIAVAWTGATQFGRSTYDKNFKAPYFNTWFVITWQTLIFPLSMLQLMFQRTNPKNYIRECGKILGSKGWSIRSLLLFAIYYGIPFNAISLLANYLMFRALTILNPGVIAPVFASQSTFCYILSMIFLGEKIFMVRVASILLCVGGITLLGYTEGFDNASSIGIVFTTLSAFFAAVYQVAFKRRIGDANSGEVSLFLTIIGITNLIFFPIIFLLKYFNQESIVWNEIPWGPVIGSAAVALLFNFLTHFGIAVTYPLFISIGTLLGVPLNALVDRIFRGADFGELKIIAALMIITGFLLMLIPTWRVERIERRLRCCCESNPHESYVNFMNDVENDDAIRQ